MRRNFNLFSFGRCNISSAHLQELPSKTVEGEGTKIFKGGTIKYNPKG